MPNDPIDDLEDQRDQDEQQKLARLSGIAPPVAIAAPALDIEDQAQQNEKAKLGRFSRQQNDSLIAAPPSPESSNGLDLPKSSPELGKRRAADEAELARVQSTGSGISQLPRAARIPLKALDTIGSVISPTTAELIPGTELHHRAVLGGLRGNIEEDIQQEGKEAQTANERAEAQARINPQPKPKEEEWQPLVVNGQPVLGPNQEPLEYEKNSGQTRPMQLPPGSTVPGKAPKEGEEPLGKDRVPQLNQMLLARYQVLHPGEQLPAQYSIPATATQKDYDRIDKAMEAEERASGTKAQQDAVNEMRRQAAQTAAENHQQGENDRQQAREDRRQRDRDQFVGPLQTAIDNYDIQKAYVDGGQHTGEGDYQLMLQFQEAIVSGQKAGIRFNQSEQARIEHARSLMDSVGATIRHATIGTYFTDNQRKDILTAMKTVRDSHQNAISRFDREHGGGERQGDTPAKSGEERPRPANVPPNYVYNANGPKGAGWYKP